MSRYRPSCVRASRRLFHVRDVRRTRHIMTGRRPCRVRAVRAVLRPPYEGCLPSRPKAWVRAKAWVRFKAWVRVKAWVRDKAWPGSGQ